MLDDSADWKHLLKTASSLVENNDKFEQRKGYKNMENFSCEFVLLETNNYIQARNILLLKVLLSNEDNFSESLITKAFVSLLYNIHLDKDSFCIMKLALERYELLTFAKGLE